MPDLNHSIAVHNKTMHTWWRMPDYIHEREEFVIRNPDCVRCGRPTTCPGHAHEDYILFEKYLDAVKTDKCDPLCSACNLMERKGMTPCPSCVKEYCWDHRPDSEKQQAENRKLIQEQFIKDMRKINNAKRRAFYQDVVKKR